MKKNVLVLAAFFLFFTVSAQESKKEEKQMWAKSVLNKKAPELVVEEWISGKPETKGKFVLIDFWATTCNPCRKVIPELNEWSKRFKEDLVVIGISYEKAEKVKAMKSPVIEYYNGIDTKKTMSNELDVRGIPHVILIDPEGIVRWEGYPLLPTDRLTTEVIENMIREYKKGDSGVASNATADKSRTTKKTMKFEIKNAGDLQNALKTVLSGGEEGSKVRVQKAVNNTKAGTQKVEEKTKIIPRQPWWGKSVINEKTPEVFVDKWITEQPNTKDKFILYHFWSTTCGPCLKSIPKLNELSKAFKDDMVIIGIAGDDSVERMKGKPVIEYYRGVDQRNQTSRQERLDLHVLSYVLLVDPRGVVRLEDVSQNLTSERISEIIKKYK